jgi:hypothetical protein
MTPGAFRKLALRIRGVTEGAHQGHTDFRSNGRIFATLGYPDDAWAMVKLSQTDQALYLERYPESFVPAAGAWGRRGSTLVRLAAADPKILAPALKFACAHSASPPTRKRPATAGRRST